MTRKEAADTIALVRWVAGRETYCGPVAPVVAEQAARRLADRARKVLGTGPEPGEVTLPRDGMR